MNIVSFDIDVKASKAVFKSATLCQSHLIESLT